MSQLPTPHHLSEFVRRAADAVAPPTDEPLWERVRGTPVDETAFAELYRRWFSPLTYFARWSVHAQADGLSDGTAADIATDAVHHAFVKLVENRGRVPTAGHAFRFTQKSARRHARKQAARHPHPPAPHRQPPLDVAASADDDPIERSKGQELFTAFRDALRELNEREREVVLYHLNGERNTDIARLLGVSDAVVGMALSRARVKLGERLRGWQSAAALVVGVATSPEATAAAVQDILRRAAAGGVRKLPLVLAAGVVLLTGGIAGGWAAWPRPTNPLPPPAAKVESLEEKNRRLFNTDVLPELMAELARMLPPDNPPRFVGVTTSGTQIECEFASDRGLVGTAQPFRLRLHYCTLRREFGVESDPFGSGKWRWVDPKRPIILDPGIPGLPTVDLGHDRFAFGQRAFDKLPPPDR